MSSSLQSRRRWRHEGEPIEDPNQTPKGWTADEPDLDENDIDGQIARCHERIEEGIMPSLFERRLSTYIKAKGLRNTMHDFEPVGLNQEVYQRLDNLKFTKRCLEAKGDDDEQLANVKGLLYAYRFGKLTWKQGLVTFWSRGVQLCEPRQFDWDDCEEFASRHDGHKGFWVEGLQGPGPVPMLAFFRFTEESFNQQFQHLMKFALQIPGAPPNRYRQFEFADDTGAVTMFLYQADLDELEQLAGRRAKRLGPMNALTPNGPLNLPTVRLEVNIIGPDNDGLLGWVPLQCMIKPGDRQSDGMVRLSGMWLRHMLYTGTVPDNRGLLYVSNTKKGLFKDMPRVNARHAQPPPDTSCAPKENSEPVPAPALVSRPRLPARACKLAPPSLKPQSSIPLTTTGVTMLPPLPLMRRETVTPPPAPGPTLAPLKLHYETPSGGPSGR